MVFCMEFYRCLGTERDGSHVLYPCIILKHLSDIGGSRLSMYKQFPHQVSFRSASLALRCRASGRRAEQSVIWMKIFWTRQVGSNGKCGWLDCVDLGRWHIGKIQFRNQVWITIYGWRVLITVLQIRWSRWFRAVVWRDPKTVWRVWLIVSMSRRTQWLKWLRFRAETIEPNRGWEEFRNRKRVPERIRGVRWDRWMSTMAVGQSSGWRVRSCRKGFLLVTQTWETGRAESTGDVIGLLWAVVEWQTVKVWRAAGLVWEIAKLRAYRRSYWSARRRSRQVLWIGEIRAQIKRIGDVLKRRRPGSWANSMALSRKEWDMICLWKRFRRRIINSHLESARICGWQEAGRMTKDADLRMYHSGSNRLRRGSERDVWERGRQGWMGLRQLWWEGLMRGIEEMQMDIFLSSIISWCRLDGQWGETADERSIHISQACTNSMTTKRVASLEDYWWSV